MADLNFKINNASGGLDLIVDRTTVQCAPDPVRFTFDLTNVTFAQDAGGNDLIDERFRRLDFYLDTGDSGTWTAPTKLISEHEDKRYALGAFVTHVYQSDGTFTVVGTVTERSLLTGWKKSFARATKTVTVGAQDDAYPTTETVCVNRVGDSDFTGAPTGATQINADSFTTASAAFTDEFGSVKRRWLFKGGSTFEWDVGINNASAPPHMCFGSYGTGKATITPASGGQALSTGGLWRQPEIQDLRFDGLIFQGDWDMSTTALDGTEAGLPNTNFPWTNAGLIFSAPHDLCINNCEFDGLRQNAIVMQSTTAGAATTGGHWAIADTSVTNCGGQYWVYSTSNDLGGATGAILGCNFFPQSDQIDGGGGRVVAFRENGHQNFHCRSTVMSSMDSSNVTAKFCDSPPVENGQIYTICFNRFEGCASPLNICGNAAAFGVSRSPALNFLIDSNHMIGDYATQRCLTVRCTGGVIRNNLLNCPGGPRLDGGSLSENAGNHSYPNANFRSHILIGDVGITPANVLATSTLIYNNTATMYRTDAENDNWSGSPSLPASIHDAWGAGGIIETANNIADGAALNDANSMGPLTTTALAAPYSLGFVGASSKTLAPSYAPDPADVVKAEPDTGSAALSGAAGELIAYRDIARAVRSVGKEDIGCWQVTA